MNSRRRMKVPSDKADNLAHHWTMRALYIAAKSSRLCRLGVKLGLPPWRPHVRFCQLRTCRRIGSGQLCADFVEKVVDDLWEQ